MAQTKHVQITKTKDGLPALMKALGQFERERVLVGIPAANAGRDDDAPINNATIGVIMEHGSPAANIPARPWLVPGVLSNKARIVKRYEGAAKRALKGDASALNAAHQVVGQETADAVKSYMRSAPFTPLKPATIAARARQRGTKHRRKGEKQYLGLIQGWMPPGLAQLVAGINPLINTGQLLRAVSYVVVRKPGSVPLVPTPTAKIDAGSSDSVGQAARNMTGGAAGSAVKEVL